MPAERLILQQLNNDPAISSNHWRYRLWLDPDGKTNRGMDYRWPILPHAGLEADQGRLTFQIIDHR